MGVETKSALFVLSQQHDTLIDDLLGGTFAMRKAGQKYLPQHPLESDDDYNHRLSTATLYPALKETIGQMVGRVFYEAISTDNIAVSLQQYVSDMDGHGNDINIFLSRVFDKALAKGVCFIVTDYANSGNTMTLADAKVANARPVNIIIDKAQVLGVKSQNINGFEQLTQFRYIEAVTEEDGEFDEKVIPQIVVMELDKIRKYRENEKGEWYVYEERPISVGNGDLKRVPVVACYTERTGFFTGVCPLLELAFLNVKHWQSQSDQDNIVNTARVPLLVRIGYQEPMLHGINASGQPIDANGDVIGEMEIGKSIIDLPEGGDLRYVEHSGAAITAGAESLASLKDDMQSAGAKLLTRTKLSFTDSQAKEERDKEISKLRLYANYLENATSEMLGNMAMWLGQDDGGNIEISGNIDADIDPNATLDMCIKLYINNVISKETLFAEAKRRGAISYLADWDNEQTKLESQSIIGMNFNAG